MIPSKTPLRRIQSKHASGSGGGGGPIDDRSFQEKEDLMLSGSRKMDVVKSDCSITSQKGKNDSISTCDEDEEEKNRFNDYLWYHGLALHEQVTGLLKYNNSFAVRRSVNREGSKALCITVRRKEEFVNYTLNHENGGWTSPKLFESVNSSTPHKKFARLNNLIDCWSICGESCIPIPRPTYIISHDAVQMSKKLGSGAFGEVWKGTAKIEGVVKDCAIKISKGTLTRKTLTEFYVEAQLLSLFDSDTVIRYYGTCSLIPPLMILMELATGETVRSYLRDNHRRVHVDTMLSFALDIVKGMAHLASKRVIHRDLAARNCLIGPDMVVKISDFGLSVRAAEIRVKTVTRAPIRWLSPETLSKGVFSEKTDVWSYGVTYWEIFTKCSKGPLQNKSTKAAVDEIKNTEYPHKLPLNIPLEIVEIMHDCHRKLPKDRPRFKDLVVSLAKLIERMPKIVKKGQTQRRNNKEQQPTKTRKFLSRISANFISATDKSKQDKLEQKDSKDRTEPSRTPGRAKAAQSVTAISPELSSPSTAEKK